MKQLFTLVILSGLIFIMGCERNSRPEIKEIVCSPESGYENSVFKLTGLCQDGDGDYLTYIWTSTLGEFIEGDNGYEVQWLSPSVAQDTTIMVKLSISDGIDIVSREKSIVVINNTEEIAVTTNDVTDITSKSAICGGRVIVDGDVTIIRRGVCWSEFPSPTTLDNKTVNESGPGTFTSYISDLEKNTTYYVRAYADYDLITVYGEEVNFTTLDNGNGINGDFIDTRDGNVYNWVSIGNQVWMQENLAWLPDVSSPTAGSKTQKFYYVQGYYGGSIEAAVETENYKEYGVLYNFPAAKNACPDGWHLPTVDEWESLFDYLGGIGVAGGKMKETGFDHWYEPNYEATNASKFTALGGGDRSIWPDFYYIKETAFFWSSEAFDESAANSFSLSYQDQAIRPYPWNKAYGFSVRCVRND